MVEKKLIANLKKKWKKSNFNTNLLVIQSSLSIHHYLHRCQHLHDVKLLLASNVNRKFWKNRPDDSSRSSLHDVHLCKNWMKISHLIEIHVRQFMQFSSIRTENKSSYFVKLIEFISLREQIHSEMKTQQKRVTTSLVYSVKLLCNLCCFKNLK